MSKIKSFVTWINRSAYLTINGFRINLGWILIAGAALLAMRT